MSARVVVDWTRCDGHGLCASLLPDLIGVDDWGFPVLPDALSEQQARRVARVCPVLALRVESRDRAVT